MYVSEVFPFQDILLLESLMHRCYVYACICGLILKILDTRYAETDMACTT